MNDSTRLLDTAAAGAGDTRAPRLLRLRTLLTVPFVLLIVLPALIIAGTSLYTGLQAVDVLSRQLMDDISARVGQAAVHQLEEASVALRATFPNAEDNQNATLGLFMDDLQLERKLFELTAGTRTTSYVYLGRSNGSFVGVDRGRAGARSAATVRLQASNEVPRKIYASRNPGDRTRLVETESRIYDAPSRPWYQLAKNAQHLVWTPVYASFASGALVTTAAQPVSTPTGTLLGVLAADVELSELSDFMKGVTVSANGVAFIVDREGMLVATSTPDQPFRFEGGVQRRVAARESSSTLVRVATQWWRASGRPVTTADGAPALGLVSSEGEQVDVAARRVIGVDGIDWDIVVAIPRSDFTAPIIKSTVSMFFVIFAALAAALLLGLWVLRRVTRDVDQLVSVTHEVSADGLPTTVPITSLSETSVLARAFSEMVARLRQSLVTIRSQNDQFMSLNATLEERVEGRTKQLAEQNVTLTEEILRRERLERELRNTSHAAQKAAEDKTRFLAILSHELRTPLQAVVGASQLLSVRQHTGVRADEIETLDAASKSLLTLIDGVLSYSRLEAGVVTPVLQAFTLKSCVDDAVRVARTANKKPGVEIVIQIDSTVPTWVRTDEGMLRQALINLVSNALKFTEQGTVSITVNVDAAKRDDDPVKLLFTVEDTGLGIDPGTQKRLFQPFQQGTDRGQAEVGSGLGLVICRLLVSALGGEIKMNSTPGVGTQMLFSILAQAVSGASEGDHAATATQAERAAHDAWAGRSKRSLRVMVVEDNDVNRELLTIMLEQLGHSVGQSSDGEAAVVHAEEHPFDVVLMDLNLPRMGGIEATRRILQAAAARGRSTPIVLALTASVSDADRALCAASGMRGFLTKPATVFSLDAALRAANSDLQSTNSVALAEGELLDLVTLNSLVELEQKRASDPFVKRLIEGFLESLPAEMTNVHQHWVAGNNMRCADAAHKLAGAASAVGARALARAARQVNECPSEADIGFMRSLIDVTSAALQAWCAVHLAGSAGKIGVTTELVVK